MIFMKRQWKIGTKMITSCSIRRVVMFAENMVYMLPLKLWVWNRRCPHLKQILTSLIFCTGRKDQKSVPSVSKVTFFENTFWDAFNMRRLFSKTCMSDFPDICSFVFPSYLQTRNYIYIYIVLMISPFAYASIYLNILFWSRVLMLFTFVSSWLSRFSLYPDLI